MSILIATIILKVVVVSNIPQLQTTKIKKRPFIGLATFRAMDYFHFLVLERMVTTFNTSTYSRCAFASNAENLCGVVSRKV
jgi:hypothetical protein